MNEKQKWYQAEYQTNDGFWEGIALKKYSLTYARKAAKKAKHFKTRIVKYTTEVVEERGSRG